LRMMRNGRNQEAWMSRIQTSHENCCAALEWCLQTPGVAALQAGISISASLNLYWRLAGWQQRGSAYMRSLKAREEWSQLSLRMQSVLLNGLGILEMAAGHLDEARRLFEQCRETFKEMGHEAATIAPLNNLALIATEQGDYATAYRWNQ